MLLQPISDVKVTQLDASSAVLAASDAVRSRLRRGRHGIGISATSSDIYLGDEDVSSGNGMLIPASTTVTLPVNTNVIDAIYVVGGTCTLTEFF